MDIATVLSPGLTFDWAIVNGDLAADDGLWTAVILSLFLDRLANEDDELPDKSGDRRGWWGDVYLPPLADGSPDHVGSRLWLLARAKQIPETAQRAQSYCLEALQWLVDDGVAASVSVPLPTFPALGQMAISVRIAQRTSAGIVNHQYDSVWNRTRNTVSMAGIALAA